MGTRYHIEFQRPFYGEVEAPWEPVAKVIGGMGEGFETLKKARAFIRDDVPAFIQHDGFWHGLKFRIVRVQRWVITDG